jgi:hypothetical protein
MDDGVQIEVSLSPAELSLVLLALEDLIGGWALDEQIRAARTLRDRLQLAESEAYRRSR